MPHGSVSALAAAGILTAAGAWASPMECLKPGAASTASVRGFADDPPSLLTIFPQGTDQMTSKVQEIVVASPRMIALMRPLLGRANPAQSESIGEGLARAVRDCASHPELSRVIADLAFSGGNDGVLRAFDANVEDAKGGVLPDASKDGGRRRVPGVSIDADSRALPNPFAPLVLRKL